MQIFRSALLGELDDGERVEADDGCKGEAPRHVKCPSSIAQIEEAEESQSFVRRQQETINRRFKQFGLLKQACRHDIRDHGDCFRSAAITTQLSIANGEPLFSVDCRDPCLDDYYYPEPGNGEDDDGESSSVGG